MVLRVLLTILTFCHHAEFAIRMLNNYNRLLKLSSIDACAHNYRLMQREFFSVDVQGHGFIIQDKIALFLFAIRMLSN